MSGIPARPRRLLVIGGGCYGSHHATRLARAADRGVLIDAEVWVIDRDPACRAAALPPRPDRRLVVAEWGRFLDRYLAGWAAGLGRRACDLVVPAPLTPHLFAEWLARALGPGRRAAPRPVPELPDTPFARALPGGGLVLSFAEWRCPVHCVEPYLCPATRQPRDWDVTRALVRYARRLRTLGVEPLAGPLVARSTHLVEGVGVHPLTDWARAARRLAGGAPGRRESALVATVSGCHGAVTVLGLAPRRGGETGRRTGRTTEPRVARAPTGRG